MRRHTSVSAPTTGPQMARSRLERALLCRRRCL